MRRLTLYTIAGLVVMILCADILCSQTTSAAKRVRRSHVTIAPKIPDAKRTPELVFLEHADSLLRMRNNDFIILKGNVVFSKGDMMMYTDSAHFFDATGSFDAFGNVRMEQGDTLFIYGDELNYDGPSELAILYANENDSVRLINRDVMLKAPSISYDMRIELGYYTEGGVLTDRDNRLRSDQGQYSPSTKDALFLKHVVLTSHSKEDSLLLVNDALYYNTESHIAEFTVPTVITNKDGRIDSDDGVYNTETGIAELYAHSIVTTIRGSTLEGDTLYYDRAKGIGEAWGNMALVDTAKQSTLMGDYGFYNEIADSAYVTGPRAVAMEYSNGDTLYIHGRYITSVLRIDTISRVVGLDTVYVERAPVAATQAPAEFVDSVIADAEMRDVASIDTLLTDTEKIIQLDSVTTLNPVAEIDSVAVADSLPVAEIVDVIPDIPHDIGEIPASVPFTPELEEPAVTEPEFTTVERFEHYPDSTHIISAWPRVRMYRSDLQGLCDSLVFTQADSMVRMYYHPVVWSDDRQIFGNMIELHVNDSTVDRAYLPDFGFMAQHIEDKFYNQLTGKRMTAWFEGGQLSRTLVEGSVEGIVYPEEEDSTINKLVNFQTANLEGFFENQVMKRMKMWAQTSGEAIPLYLAKYTDLHLPQFQWYDDMRPMYPDDIFNVPEAMNQLMSDRPLPSDTENNMQDNPVPEVQNDNIAPEPEEPSAEEEQPDNMEPSNETPSNETPSNETPLNEVENPSETEEPSPEAEILATLSSED